MSISIEVIATTISGSISDWGKVARIVPLFAEHGFDDVRLHETGSHQEARSRARELITAGGRVVISAGGSGTFNAVLEGCCDAGVPLDEIRLGFLRKGSADLIGKVLEMPDEIEEAIAVFVRSISAGYTEPCDILRADGPGVLAPRRFVGYGGAELFGRIPHYTENRFMKWYKGTLSQFFGDLGPFTTGMILAMGERFFRAPWQPRRRWRIAVDGEQVAEGCYQALIIVNGYLGPEMAFSSDPLGSGRFQLFALRDLGNRKLLAQARRARAGTIMAEPERWGMETWQISDTLGLELSGGEQFPLNIDGSTLICHGSAEVKLIDRINLISRTAAG